MTETGPNTDGRSKRKILNPEDAKTFNDAFFQKYFSI